MPSVWEWAGDPAAVDGWTVIGEQDGVELALISYDSLNGATSQPLAEAGIPGAWLMPREKAMELHDRIGAMDEVFWPGFNPTVVRVEDDQIIERLYPPGDPRAASSASSEQEPS